jgi:hypothetical protein
MVMGGHCRLGQCSGMTPDGHSGRDGLEHPSRVDWVAPHLRQLDSLDGVELPRTRKPLELGSAAIAEGDARPGH